MRLFFLVLTVWFSWPLAGMADLPPISATESAPSVLVLDSYHFGNTWSDQELAGLRQGLKQSGQPVNMFVEFMDARRFAGKDYGALNLRLFRRKYQTENIRLLIVLDDAALNFAVKNRSLLFPDVPIIFSGINAEGFTPLPDTTRATGILEKADVAGTLRLARQLTPERRKVWVLHDQTLEGMALRRFVESESSQFTNDFSFRYTPPLTLKELEKSLHSLGADELVLYIQYVQDEKGQTLGGKNATLKSLMETSSAPFYVLHGSDQDWVGIGGSVLNPRVMGEAASKCVITALASPSTNSLPPPLPSPTVMVVDDTQLRRFGVSPGRVPNDALVMRRSESAWDKYRYEICGIIAFLVLLCAGLAALAAKNASMRRSREALQHSEERYRTLVEAQTDAIVRWLPDGTRTYVNDAYAHYYGQPRESLLGTSFLPRLKPEHAQQVKDRIARLTPENPAASGEHLITMPDGIEHWYQWTDRGLFDAQGRLIELLSVGQEITTRKRAEVITSVLSELGRKLGAAARRTDAADIILKAADELLGWDAASIDLYDATANIIQPVIALDVINGKRQLVPPAYTDVPPSPFLASIIREGGRLIDRSKDSAANKIQLAAFGDTQRHSASLLFVPMREGSRAIGVITVQSYRPGFYSLEGLETLQMLADHVAGALERIKAAEALRQSERRYRALAETNAIGIWQINAQRQTVYANPAMLKMLEFEKLEGLAGRSINEFVAPESLAVVQAEFDIHKTEGATICEAVIVGQRGGRRDTVASGAPLIAPDGQPLGLIGTFVDVTERKQVEEALRRSEERFRNLVEGARDAVYSIAPDGAISTLNPAFETITGWTREEWLGRHFGQIVAEADRPIAYQMFQRVMNGDRPPTFELRIHTKSSGDVPMEFTVTPQKQEAQVIGLLGIGRDIRERKLLEEQLRQMQKMESIGQLAAGVAHDFNNLLTVQQGYLSLLKLELQDNSVAADAVREAFAASERAANLTRQLLLFSRRQVMQPRQMDVNETVRQLARMFDRLLGERIRLNFECAPDLPLIHADPGMVEQVVMNLAVNARDAMPNGGRLTIGTAAVNIPESTPLANPEARPGKFVCLTVTDSGTGISPEVMPHIFEPFFTTKDVGKGTGLGLATVYGIVKQHKGWLEVDNAAEQGARFRVFFPACPAATPVPVGTAPSQGHELRGSETILVVEDEPALRMMVEQVLKRHGYKVLTAVSGTDALSVWETADSPIQLLLTDMVMPDTLTGRDLADRLLAREPGLKVIFTSGYSADMFSRQRLLEPGQRFLPKPFQTKELLQIVRGCLDGLPEA